MQDRLPRLLVCLGFLLGAAALRAAAATPPAPVLLLHSYHPAMPWTEAVTRGVRAGLADAADPAGAGLVVEYLDTKNIDSRAWLEHAAAGLRLKYNGRLPRVVLCADDDAFTFLLERGRQLFPGVPVVFCGVNFFRPALLAGKREFTGVVEAIDIRGTLRLALELRPDTGRIVVVNDRSATGLANAAKLAELGGRLGGRPIELWDALTMAELEARAAALPAATAVLLLTFNRDAAGAVWSYEESARRLAAATRAPVWGCWDFLVGHGIVGGVVTSGEAQGAAAAALVRRVLAGEPPSAIPVVTDSPNRAMFDARALARFGIAESALPADSFVLFKEPSFFTRHPSLFHLLMAVSAALAVCVLYLLLHIGTRRRARRRLEATEVRYRQLSELAFEGIVVHDGRRFVDVNGAFLALTGYGRAELFAQDISAIIAPEQRAAVLERIAAGDDGVYEALFLRRDGSRFPAEVHVRYAEWTDGRRYRVAVLRDLSARRAAETAARESEAKFARVFHASPDGIYLQRQDDGKILDANPQLARLFGLTRHGLLGRTLPELGLWADPGQLAALRARIDAEETVNDFEAGFRSADGRTFTGLVSAAVTEIGGARCVLAIIRDVSAARRAEAEQAERERFIDAILGAVPDFVFVFDRPAGRFSFVNDEAARITGYAVADLLAMERGDIFDRVHPDDKAIVAGAYDSITGLADGQVHHCEYRLRRRDGDWVWLQMRELVFSRDAAGAPDRILGSGSDVTARHAAETALLASEAQYRGLAEASPEMVYLVDGDGVVRYVNPAASRMFAAPADAVVGRRLADLFPPELAARHLAAVRRVIETGERLQTETLERFPSGECWIDVRLGPVRDAAGAVTAALGLSSDITTRKRAEEAMRASLAEKEVLLKEIHHRVKNNMQVISSLLSLQAGRSPEPAIRRFVEESRARVRSMALVHETLYRTGDFSRVALAHYLRDLAASLARTYAETRVAVAIEGVELTIPVDLAVPCGLAVNELVSNCFKYAFAGKDGGRDGGRIAIILAEPEPGLAEVTVADNGVGLPPDFAERRTRSLGLQIVDQLVAQLEGRLEFSSGEGTRFTIRFRCQPAD